MAYVHFILDGIRDTEIASSWPVDAHVAIAVISCFRRLLFTRKVPSGKFLEDNT